MSEVGIFLFFFGKWQTKEIQVVLGIGSDLALFVVWVTALVFNYE